MRICLAPMDGITDLAYRTICQETHHTYGHPDDTLMLRTEFMSAEGYMHAPHGVIKHLFKTDYEPTLIAQIFGGTTDPLLSCAVDIVEKYGFAGVEINMGCPSPSVMKCDAGSAMLKDKKKTLGILAQIHEQLPVSLSLKTRAGLTQDDKPAQFDFLLEASQYVSMITVHARTYAQSHAGEVDRSFVYALKKALPDKIIIGNGGIRSYNDARVLTAAGNLDGGMIGQAAIGNPWILTPHTPTINEKFDVILRHLRMMMAAEYLFDAAHQSMTDRLTMPTYADLCMTTTQIDHLVETSPRTRWTPLEFRKYLFAAISGLPGNKHIKQSIPARRDFMTLRDGLERYREQLLTVPDSQ